MSGHSCHFRDFVWIRFLTWTPKNVFKNRGMLATLKSLAEVDCSFWSSEVLNWKQKFKNMVSAEDEAEMVISKISAE